jgi:hypothetical protein
MTGSEKLKESNFFSQKNTGAMISSSKWFN